MRLVSDQSFTTNKIDLRFGNTGFLKAYWESMDKTLADLGLATTIISPSWSMDYEKEGPKESLKEQIREIHALVGNAETKGKQILVGCGAQQLLMAAMYAMGKVYSLDTVYAKPPYWFRFPEIAGMVHMKFRNDDEFEAGSLDTAVNVITTPSNPENIIGYGKTSKHCLYDLCYNWPQYTDVVKYNEDVMVFSLAKTLGHAGSRIGWALVSDERVSDLMLKYIEYTSGGISVEAQERATQLLKAQTFFLTHDPLKDKSCFHMSKILLDNRWKALEKVGLLTAEHPSCIQILNKSGMFAWGRHRSLFDNTDVNVSDELNKAFDLLVINGNLSCPGANNKFRLNVGASESAFNALIEKMSF